MVKATFTPLWIAALLLSTVALVEGFIRPQYQETGRASKGRRQQYERSTGSGSSASSGTPEGNLERMQFDYSTSSSSTEVVHEDGQQQLAKVHQLAATAPEGTDCWKQAVASLQDNCRSALSDKGVKNKLSLQFLMCQLRQDTKHEASLIEECLELNRVANPRDPNQLQAALGECIRRLPEWLYQQYVTEGRYVESMCHFLQNEVFRSNMDTMVQSMARAGKDTTKTLFELLKQTHTMGTGISKIQESQDQELQHLAKVLSFLLEHTKLAEQHQRSLEHGEEKLNKISDAMKSLHTLQLDFSATQQAVADHITAELEAHRTKLNEVDSGIKGVSNGVEAAQKQTEALVQSQKSQMNHLGDLSSVLTGITKSQEDAAIKATSLDTTMNSLVSNIHSLGNNLRELGTATKEVEDVVGRVTEKQDSFFSITERVFDDMRRVEAVIGELSNAVQLISTIVFYTVLAVVVTIGTVPQLNSGRFWMLMTVLVTFLAENALRKSAIESLTSGEILNDETAGVLNGNSTPLLVTLGSFLASDGTTLSSSPYSTFLARVSAGQWMVRYLGLFLIALFGVRALLTFKSEEDKFVAWTKKALIEYHQQPHHQPTTGQAHQQQAAPRTGSSRKSAAGRTSTTSKQHASVSPAPPTEDSTSISPDRDDGGAEMVPPSAAPPKKKGGRSSSSRRK